MALAAAAALLLALAATAQNETGLLAPAPAPAPAPGPEPPPPWERPVIWAASNRGLAPQRLTAYNKTHYYQLLPAAESKGLVVMFHGCARLARAFFPYHPTRCPECVGLPEHVSHTKQALRLGYSVLAMDPSDSRHQCWSSSSSRAGYINDQPNVVEAVTRFVADHGLAGKRLILWGASSGGTLALKLPGTLAAMAQRGAAGAGAGQVAASQAAVGPVLRLTGIISEVASPQDFGAFDAAGRLTLPDYPPTVFVYMERDGSQADALRNVELLRNNSIPADAIESPMRRIGPTFFSDRSAVISLEQSVRVWEGLRDIGLLSPTGYLVADPSVEDDPRLASFNWMPRLRRLLPWLAPNSPTLSLVLRTSLIRQSMYVAYARHDAVSDWFTACVKFIEQRGETPLEELAQRYAVKGGKLARLAAFPPPPGPAPAPEAAEEQEAAEAAAAFEEVVAAASGQGAAPAPAPAPSVEPAEGPVR